MHDPFLVGRGQTVSDLHLIINCFAQRYRSAPDPLAQGLAFQQLRNQVRYAVMSRHLMDSKNVGVVQRRSCPRFLLKTAQAIGIRGEGLGQNFDGYLSVQTCIVRAIHFAHPACTEW